MIIKKRIFHWFSRLTKYTILYFFLIGAASCQENNSNNKIIDLNLYSNYSKTSKHLLSELTTEIEYIPLEKTKASIFGDVWNISVGTKYIMVLPTTSDRVLLFDRNGKFLKKLGSIGKGPGEVTQFNWAELSPNEKYIVCFCQSMRKLQIFSTDDYSLKELSLEYPSTQFTFLDNDHLIVQIPQKLAKISNYNLFTITTIPSGKSKGIFKIEDNFRGAQSVSSSLFLLKGSAIYHNPYDDVIYSINSKGKIKKKYNLNLVRDNTKNPQKNIDNLVEFKKGQPKVFRFLESNNYIFIYGHNNGPIRYIHDKKSGNGSCLPKDPEKWVGSIYNDIDSGPNFWPEAISLEGKLFQWHHPIDLINDSTTDNNKLNDIDQFQKIFSQIKPEDNMVITLLK